MKSPFARNTGIVAVVMLLAACGQTGPLYMPKPPVKAAPVNVPPPPPHTPEAATPAQSSNQ